MLGVFGVLLMCQLFILTTPPPTAYLSLLPPAFIFVLCMTCILRCPHSPLTCQSSPHRNHKARQPPTLHPATPPSGVWASDRPSEERLCHDVVIVFKDPGCL